MINVTTLAVSLTLSFSQPTDQPEHRDATESIYSSTQVSPASDTPVDDTLAAETPIDELPVDYWMMYHYLLGGAEYAPTMLDRFLSELDERVDDPESRAHATALMNIFLAQVAKLHPELLDDWIAEALDMSEDVQLLFAYTAWAADPDNCADRIAKIIDAMPEDSKHVDRLLRLHEQTPSNLKELSPSNGSVLDYWWISFMATGQTEYIGLIVNTLPPKDVTYDNFDGDIMAITVAGAAIWSLTSNAHQHPAVYKFLKQQRADELGPWPVLDKIISDVESDLAESPSPAPSASDED